MHTVRPVVIGIMGSLNLNRRTGHRSNRLSLGEVEHVRGTPPLPQCHGWHGAVDRPTLVWVELVRRTGSRVWYGSVRRGVAAARPVDKWRKGNSIHLLHMAQGDKLWRSILRSE